MAAPESHFYDLTYMSQTMATGSVTAVLQFIGDDREEAWSVGFPITMSITVGGTIVTGASATITKLVDRATINASGEIEVTGLPFDSEVTLEYTGTGVGEHFEIVFETMPAPHFKKNLANVPIEENISTGGVPDAYQEVQWIGFTGTQYINTGLTFDQDSSFDLAMSFSSHNDGDNVFGSRSGASQNNISIAFSTGQGYSADFNNANYATYRATLAANTVQNNKKYRVVCNKTARAIYDEGGSVLAQNNTAWSGSFTCPTTALIGSCGGSPYKTNKLSGRIYYVKMVHNNANYKFVPCYRKADDVAGMYDVENDVFYTNAGTGSFVVGPEVSGQAQIVLTNANAEMMPELPFYATLMPQSEIANYSNAEIVKVTNKTVNGLLTYFDMERAQKNTTAKRFVIGDIVASGVYADEVPFMEDYDGNVEREGWIGTEDIENGAVTADKLSATAILDKVYPVGSIFMSMTLDTPSKVAQAIGGVWEVFSTGRMLVGVDSGDTDFETAGLTGGSKSMQKHSHTRGTMEIDGWFRSAGWDAGQEASGAFFLGGGATNHWMAHNAKTDTIYAINFAASRTWSGHTSEEGSGNSGNMSPYTTVYMYKRRS